MIKAAGESVDYQALAELRFEIRRFLHFSEQAAHTAGIEPQQHQALLAIKGFQSSREATVGSIAERLLIHHHSAVGLIDRLEAKGLTRRMRSQEDRRKIILRLTVRGEGVLQKLSVLHRAELRSAGPALLGALLAVLPQEGSNTMDRKGARPNGKLP